MSVQDPCICFRYLHMKSSGNASLSKSLAQGIDQRPQRASSLPETLGKVCLLNSTWFLDWGILLPAYGILVK